MQPILPPPPVAPQDVARVAHTQLRERIIAGEWQEDLRVFLEERVGKQRAKAWGIPSQIDSPLLQLGGAVSRLYDFDPVVEHEDANAAREMTELALELQVWSVCAEAQVVTETCNEAAVRVDRDDTNRIALRLVYPSLLSGQSSAVAPGRPLELVERQVRQNKGELGWVSVRCSILDADRPTYVVEAKDGAEVESLVGSEYPWRWPDGRPYLPYSLRHSVRTPRSLFNAWYRSETVQGTMLAGVLATLIDHAGINACWPQRWGVGVQPVGATQVEAGGGASQVVADPATIILFEAMGEKQPMLGQWQTAADIGAMQDLYERRVGMLALAWGLAPTDLVRTGADPRSGVSLAIQESAARRAQNRAAPRYKDHDERLLALIAAEVNRDRPQAQRLPTSGYRVRYQLLPLSPAEQEDRRREALDLLDRRLISPAEARARILEQDPVAAARDLAALNDPNPAPPRRTTTTRPRRTAAPPPAPETTT